MPKQTAKNKKIIWIISLVVVVLLLFKTASFFSFAYQLIFNKNIELKKSDGNINVLLMGVGGGQHEGPDLTDTMIFSSISVEKNKIFLSSIPRDLWIPDIKEKINTAYAIGNGKQKDGGLILSKAVVEKVVGQPIDYIVVVDFDGFIKAVDLVGGIDIDVENAFDDYQYPNEDKRDDLCGHTLEEATVLIASGSATEVFPCRYEHVHFDKGLQHMDGARSLIFVRSRYAIGDEGTDFARSRRQQKVINAFKDKIFSVGTILNPLRIANLYSVLSDHIHTNIPQDKFDDFVKLGNKMKHASIQSAVIDVGDKALNKKGLLINPPIESFNGAWVLIPRVGNGNFSEIQNYITCILASKVCEIK